jgi:plasmid stabilization system protein ParE
MMVRIVVQPEGEADLAGAYSWYAARRDGLGDEFLAEVDRAFAHIVANPILPRPRFRKTRQVSLRRFPYVVLYIVRDDMAYVLAVLHERRKPALMRSRARGFQEGD